MLFTFFKNKVWFPPLVFCPNKKYIFKAANLTIDDGLYAPTGLPCAPPEGLMGPATSSRDLEEWEEDGLGRGRRTRRITLSSRSRDLFFFC